MPYTQVRNGTSPRGKNVLNIELFELFDFLDPASVFEVSDMALLIPELWDFCLLSNATFFLS